MQKQQIVVVAVTICKSSSGYFTGIMINNPTNNTITIYDNLKAEAPIIATIDFDTSTTPTFLPYNLNFKRGLTIVTAGTPDLTVIFK